MPRRRFLSNRTKFYTPPHLLWRHFSKSHILEGLNCTLVASDQNSTDTTALTRQETSSRRLTSNIHGSARHMGWWHRVLIPTPLTLSAAKAGRNHLNKSSIPLLPTGIGERYSQSEPNHIKFMSSSAFLRRCELTQWSPEINQYSTQLRPSHSFP